MKKTNKYVLFSIITLLVSGGSGVGLGIGLTHYLNDHPFPPSVDKDKIHFACIGDSITWGAGVYFQRSTGTYEAILNNKLGDEYQVLNYGLNGRTLLSNADMPYIKEDFYKISHDYEFANYIIMLGSNDSKPYNWKYAGTSGENYKNELKDFLNSYINLSSHPNVYVMQPPAVFKINDKEPYDISNEVIKNEIYHLVKEVGDELGITTIDLYTITENHPEYFPDGCHPNKEGNTVIADAIYDAISH